MTEPRIRKSEPMRIGEDVVIRQIFTCTDPKSEYFQKDIFMTDTDLFDNSKVTTTEL